jgi:hypothetical protein
MANIPGGQGLLPGVETNFQSVGAGVAGNVGTLIPAIIGLGSRSEVVVTLALGMGKDGLNPTYTSTSGQDGRHFQLLQSPIVTNRTTLFLNGVPLIGTEGSITTTTTFSHQYQYLLDIANGEILLQAAYIVNQGGSNYIPSPNNIGIGTIQNLTLPDTNAPSETWTIKCISVQRNNSNQPIAGTAVFSSFGTVSGSPLDANGNPITWVANNTVVSNGVLSFSLLETENNSFVVISPFNPGDYFSIEVQSGVLPQNASLTASYIATGDINNPTMQFSSPAVQTAYGAPSLSNTLAIGCQLAFANQAPAIMCVEAAPALPRRTSYVMETNFPGLSTNVNDFIIPFPAGVIPDINSQIHVFVTNPSTSIETQLIPNQYPYYTLGTAGQPTESAFVFSNTQPPGGYSFDYTVVQSVEALNFATDGYLNANYATQVNAYFSSATVGEFNNTYIGMNLVVLDATYSQNVGTFEIVAVNDGILEVSAINNTPPFAALVNNTSVSFNLIDVSTGLVIGSSSGTDGTLTSIGGTSTGTFNSTAINFNTFGGIGGLTDGAIQLQITTATTVTNESFFVITDYNSGSNTLTIAETFVTETGLRFEIQNPALTSEYLVLNHNIVPNNYSLRVTVVDERDASFYDAGWELALASLETQECSIVCPLPQQTISIIFQNTVQHCITMSSLTYKKERVAFIGAIKGLLPDNLTGAKLAAVESLGILEGIQGNTVAEILAGDTEDLLNYSVSAAYGDTYRCVYFFPSSIVVQVGADQQTLDGFYLAAAGAGWQSAQNYVAMPMTNKVLTGFTILSTSVYNELVLEQLAAAGVTTLDQVAGGGLVNWGLTTTQSGFPQEQEISVIFIRDAIAKALRAGFAGFIGQPGTPQALTNMIARGQALFKSFISQQLITNYTNLVIVQDPIEPRQFNVSATVIPNFPINWIYAKIDVGTSVTA